MSLVDELQKLQQLHDSGAIDDTEFAAAKARLLGGPPEIPRMSHTWANDAPVDADRIERETRQWAFVLHLSMLAGYVVPIAGLMAPIIIWQVKKNELPGLDEHGVNAVNWIISSLIYLIGCAVLCIVLIGFPLLIALLIVDIVFPIMAAIKANNGETWKYPWTIEFIKPQQSW
ncbi:MAG: DUF4870 domain-containing protein [Planctomycetota bacterium]